jgi:hypothetical protein
MGTNKAVLAIYLADTQDAQCPYLTDNKQYLDACLDKSVSHLYQVFDMVAYTMKLGNFYAVAQTTIHKCEKYF